MPALSSLTLAGTGTNTYVYTPSHDEGDVHVFKNKDVNGVPVGDSILTMSLRQTPSGYKAKLKLVVPVVVTETINGVASPLVARQNWVSSEFFFSDKSTLAERQELIAQWADIFDADQTLIQSVVASLEGLY